MKNKIKVISFLLVLVLFVGCSKGDEGNGEETNDNTPQVQTKDEKPVSFENLREKKTPFLKVGDKEVSYKEYYKFYDLYAGIIALQQQLNNNVVNLMVRDAIITKDLEEKNIEVKQEEVDAEIKKYIENLGGENEFIKYLNMLGVEKSVFEENVKNSLKDAKHKSLFIEEQEVSDKDMEDYYEANKNSIDNVIAKHILVDDEELAAEISQKLKDGEDFKELSDEHSKDEKAKSNGGELGKITSKGFDEDFVNAAFKLDDNEVSDPVKTQFGYHIIVVTKNNVGMDKNKETIKNNVASEKYEKYLEEKIKSSDVKFYDYDGDEIK